MSTIFVKVKKEKNYTVVDNTFIKDSSLSWKAKGVMTYLLSLPDDWELHLSELQNHATDGRDSLRNALKELVEKGYLIKVQQKNNKGQFSNNKYIIVENPYEDVPYTENSLTEKTKLQSTDKQSTDKQSTDNNIYESGKSDSATSKTKHKYGEYQNVLLTDNEMEKLKIDYGEEQTNKAIQYLSESKEMKGYKYKSDYLAMKKWVFKALDEKDKPKYQKQGAFDHIQSEREWHDKVAKMTQEEVDNLF